MKLVHFKPRPFWVSTDIEMIDCQTGFGNPSGHAAAAFGLTFAVALEISLHRPSFGIWVTIVSFVASFVFGATVSYSRMVLGLHTLDQVIYGALYGIWSACFMQFCLRSHIDKESGTLLRS